MRPGTGAPLRRMADSVEAGVTGPDDRTAWDRLRADPQQRRASSDEVLGYGDHVYVEEPAALREAVVERLTGALSGAGS